MRIWRIKLNNFRGVAEREITLSTSGVTIIEGPNEIGKSCIPEAIDLIFEYLDSSGDKVVKSVKPLNADRGAEVEVELTTGEYHVIYHKRWHVKPETTLRVLTPRAENLTGRDAHDRMTAILSETLDQALWKALRYQQGASITQAALGDSQTLAAALDAAVSGSALGGDEEADLFKRVEAERLKYFTQTGRPSSERTKVQEEVRTLDDQISSITQDLMRLDDLADKHRLLIHDRTSLLADQAGMKDSIQVYQAKWKQIESRQSEIETLKAKLAEAEALAERAKSLSDARSRFIENCKKAEAALELLKKEAELEAPNIESVRSAQSQAKQSRDQARLDQKQTDNRRRLADEDLKYFKDVFDLETMSERHQRAIEAEKQLNEAETFLERCSITPALLDKIEGAYLLASETRARLRTENSTLRIRALQSFELGESDVIRQIAQGEVVESIANEEMNLVLANLAQITVVSGSTGRQLQEDAQKAEEDLANLYENAGITGDQPFVQAKELEGNRKGAEQESKTAKKALKDNLRDLTVTSLAEKIERLKEKVDDYESTRPTVPPLPDGLDAAEATSKEAAKTAEEVKELFDASQEQLDILSKKLSELESTITARNAQIALLDQQYSAAAKELDDSRQKVSDETIQAELTAAKEASSVAKKAYQSAKDELASFDPESTKTLLDNALQVKERADKKFKETEEELSRTKSELDIRGESGLQSSLDNLKSLQLQKEREKHSIDRQGEAAALLYSTLTAHRDAAQRSYVGPFRDQLESLGRTVFGPSFGVELDHTKLRVVARTLDGVTVPYDSLSGGAREQLSLLARLACAALVSPALSSDSHSGVPVIIDDALGYSDSERLERLGAVLSIAGRQSQVIILTCMPERYRDVGEATSVHLDRG